jgi:aminoglycoside phosphotransferase (APT) family kinase protein
MQSGEPAQSPRLTPSRHEFDRARLAAWLREHVEGADGPLEIAQFEGGQSNPTYRLRCGANAFVLRRKPPGQLLASAHAVDREYRVMKALAATEVPVPRVHALCDDDSIIGSMFYVMDYVPGRVFWDQRLPDLAPAERAAMFDSMNQTIATLHAVDPGTIGLGDYGRPGNYFARQLARWTKQYRASETEPSAAMDGLIDWLNPRVPPDGETRIVHGDFRMDNLLFHASEPRVVAVLDWELSTLGDPLVDFAYQVMAWRIAPELFRGLAGVDHAASGIPTEAEYVAAYCRRTLRADIPHWETYIVFNMFRIAAILAGVYKRALDGNAASTQALDLGRRGRLIADQAWRLARRRD